MRIKEVCERTGLTDRAIRLYMENGLVSPKQESNYMGRCSYTFSEEDARILEAVATLRRADFSIADIVKMKESPESLPNIVARHRQKLAEDITAKQNILASLKQYDAQAQNDYYALAHAISTSASRNSIPKEDSGMNFKDFKAMLQKRIPALIALVLMLLSVFYVSVLGIRTAFANVSVAQGGGHAIEYQWSLAAVVEHWEILLAAVALLGGVAALIVYLAGGKRYWLIVLGALGAASIVCLLLMPAADRETCYFFEFLAYRGSFVWQIFANVPEIIVKAAKFVPIVVGMALSAVGFVLDRQPDQE